ncbi:MAG: YggS family pyridoxal phosphate-dependent enzyme [Clostridia bacterium]|jgi:pyridoxal phosphate enzyme (YggS family)|nr:YggS family pyridoxal phosphate-dependent enzyme [Bacillota bacterium]MBR0051880.1 YggS family pyridoxal phosphate-dependent enzyme [Bacillota bacterium]MBR2098381.1 YggS family pyridoxal phosphate-dependent enzyme [Bacillota bacterium]MCR4724830.1 YggS family pyridoxal phosphate-dependent enzyme [Clostridia bacterium]
MSITQNIEEIRGRMAQAAVRSGRKPEDVLLIAVTKLHEPDEIEEAIAAGVTDIAENKVQEIQKKFDQIHSPVNWHLIGHLQTNKVKYIIDKVVMIHSVDSVHLAQEIDKRAAAAGKTMDVLLQVNAAHEESKFGLDPKDVPQVFREILDSCPNVKIRGLMHIAPWSEDPEEIRPYFKEVKDLFDTLAAVEHPNADFKYLSMGMSHDFETAIEEGANIIRVGTSIFGERDYSKKMGGM